MVLSLFEVKMIVYVGWAWKLLVFLLLFKECVMEMVVYYVKIININKLNYCCYLIVRGVLSLNFYIKLIIFRNLKYVFDYV